MPFLQQTRQEYAYAPEKNQPVYLSAALKLGAMPFAHLLFCYCVMEFKAIPSKKKALYIWDTFLAAINTATNFETQDTTKIELSIETCGDETVHSLVRNEIDDVRFMRNQALAMNRVKRYFTSSERIPPTILFDNWVKAMVARQGETFWREVLAIMHDDVIRAPTDYAGNLEKIPALRLDLIAAGFNKVAAAVKTGIG
jgi:hypothetical protein